MKKRFYPTRKDIKQLFAELNSKYNLGLNVDMVEYGYNDRHQCNIKGMEKRRIKLHGKLTNHQREYVEYQIKNTQQSVELI